MSSGYSGTTYLGLIIILVSSLIGSVVMISAAIGEAEAVIYFSVFSGLLTHHFIDLMNFGWPLCAVLGAAGALTLALGLIKDEKRSATPASRVSLEP